MATAPIRTCMGCQLKSNDKDADADTFHQCPLCQVMESGKAEEDQAGFFCSQACFATNWLAHRDSVHQNSTADQKKRQKERVKETIKSEEKKKKKEAAAANAAENEKEKIKKSSRKSSRRDEDEEEEGEHDEVENADDTLTVSPWAVLPSAAECAESKTAVVEPALSLQTTRKAVIACKASPQLAEGQQSPKKKQSKKEPAADVEEEDEEASLTALWWSAATAAAHFLQSSCVAHASSSSSSQSSSSSAAGTVSIKGHKEGNTTVVVVVTGDALTAHGFAWAARCAGLSGRIRLHVEEEEEEEPVGSEGTGDTARSSLSPSSLPSGFFIVVTTERAYQKMAVAAAAAGGVAPVALSGGVAHPHTADNVDTSAKTLLQFFFSPNRAKQVVSSTLLLITLPDVAAPEELQRIDLPAFFFVGEDAEPEEEDDSPAVYTHRMRCFPSRQFAWMRESFRQGYALLHLHADKERRPGDEKGSEDEDEEDEEERIIWELDDRVSTCLANGDREGAVYYLISRYHLYYNAPSTSKRVSSGESHLDHNKDRSSNIARSSRVGGQSERFRRLLLHTFRCDWGALDLVHAHHRFMDFTRELLHQDEGFTQSVLSTAAAAALAQPNLAASSGGNAAVTSFFGASTTSPSPALRAQAAAALHQQQLQLRRTGSVSAGLGTGVGRSLADVALKALLAVVSSLPPLTTTTTTTTTPPALKAWNDAIAVFLPPSTAAAGSSATKKKASAAEHAAAAARLVNSRTVPTNFCEVVPRLQLQAFLSHIYPYVMATSGNGSASSASAANTNPLAVSGRRLLDSLGELWGIERILPGSKAVLHAIEAEKKKLKSGQLTATAVDMNAGVVVIVLSALQRAAERVDLRLGMKQAPAEASYVHSVLFLLYEMLSGSLTPTLATGDAKKEKASDSDNNNNNNNNNSTKKAIPLSLSLEEVQRRLQWNRSSLGASVGSLKEFLARVELYHETNASGSAAAAAASEGGSKKSKTLSSLSGRQTAAARREAEKLSKERETLTMLSSPAAQFFLSQPVRLPSAPSSSSSSSSASKSSSPAALRSTNVPLTLPWVSLPIADQTERHRQHLRRLAAEEILSAMPKEAQRPMYIGDVGNLIGKWNHFNAKYDGALGVRLQDFLEAHPQLWTVVGNLVTRRKAGTLEPVKIRYDENNYNDDSSDDDDNRKARDRDALTGMKSGQKRKKMFLSKKEKQAKMEARDAEKSSKARKKQLVKAFNQSRNNRNYKQIDPSARVPGYVKHGPRKIKGRGKKANIRNYKRGSAN